MVLIEHLHKQGALPPELNRPLAGPQQFREHVMASDIVVVSAARTAVGRAIRMCVEGRDPEAAALLGLLR